MTTVVDLHAVNGVVPDCDVYIGRRTMAGKRHYPHSPWHNPFRIGKEGTREEVIEKFRAWLIGQPYLLAHLPELRGKTLGCWCKPDAACHGDVLAELADSPLPLLRRCDCGCIGAEHRLIWDGDEFKGTRCEAHGGHKFAMAAPA